MSATPPLPPEDAVGAWVPHGRFQLDPSASGVLDGLRFAAKDLFDVAGHVTGAGNPAWLASHAPARAHSPAVAAMLDAGATLVGKTVTDELAYSIHGDNLHYGAPHNTRAPDRVTGGSSSGSAAAVAAGLCDLALGTDTGGSTRVPASYCGLWGLRTTHGRIPAQGLVPLSPMFDTTTWLARDADVFARVAPVLLDAEPDRDWKGALLLADTQEEADAAFLPLIDGVAAAVAALGIPVQGARAPESSLETWRQTYITVSGWDAWRTHGDWITRQRPAFAPAVDSRWRAAAAIGADAAAQADALRERLRAALRAQLGETRFAILPSASSAALRRDAQPDTVDQARMRTFRMTSLAGIAGLPQVSIPFLGADGLPYGVSIMGPAGSDQALIRLACELGRRLGALGTAASTNRDEAMAQ
ncbi:amidase [Orrella dioscoreae]|uniref:Amidase n=1 Tax=Orrella dioscoreae TaxID=1851544 RepID=A0A1C3K5R3_9BURK|nr:amidase [Orrella dioscoreae]SBT26836.1 Amidase [Orrella dioscoreae]SOE52435.1 Amidase [Orrella dioscoreae]